MSKTTIPDGPPDVRERVECLLDTAIKHTLEPYGHDNRYTNEWLAPNSKVRSTLASRGFVLDNLGIYVDFAEVMQTEVPVEDLDTDYARTVIDGFVGVNNDQYRGGVEAFIGFETGDTKLGVLGRFKKPVSAYSAERAGRSCAIATAEAHNLAHFLGIPILTTNGTAFYDGKSRAERLGGGHYFSLAYSEHGVTLWDPTNPAFAQDKGRTIQMTFQERVTTVELAALASGHLVTIDNSDLEPGYDVRQFGFKAASVFPNAVMLAKQGKLMAAAMVENGNPAKLKEEAVSQSVEDFIELSYAQIDPYFEQFFAARVGEAS